MIAHDVQAAVPEMVRCPRCDTEKSRAEFPRNRSKPNGLGTYCVPCNRSIQRDYSRGVATRVKPPVENKMCSRCGAVCPASEFYRNAGRSDGLSGYCKACQDAAIDSWCDRNPERVREQSSNDGKRARERFPERKAADDRRYREANPDVIHANRWRRKAMKRGASVERVYRSVVFRRYWGACHICGLSVDPSDWHMDHIVPLSRGGDHSYDNVAVSHPRCNLVKGSRLMSEMSLTMGAARE